MTAARALSAVPQLTRRSPAQVRVLREREAHQRELVQRRGAATGRVMPYR